MHIKYEILRKVCVKLKIVCLLGNNLIKRNLNVNKQLVSKKMKARLHIMFYVHERKR